MSADSTARKQVGRPFERGQSGNPAGRPRGSRNKLSEAFIADLCATWEEHGRTVIERVIAEAPAAYVKVVAGVVPRELNVKGEDPFAHMSDEDLEHAISILKAAISEERVKAESVAASESAH